MVGPRAAGAAAALVAEGRVLGRVLAAAVIAALLFSAGEMLGLLA